jgi:ppGpp synthetase/RelA/SpoT-type nucleotidyltranferase
MNIPQPLIEAYGELKPYLQEVERRLTEALRSYAQERLLPLVARVKTIESAAEKIETGRYRSFGEIDDLVACTMVIPNLAHENEAIEHCRRLFRIDEIKRRSSTQKSPELFRFDSTRIYGFINRPEGQDDSISLSIFDIKFEIQIRTAFEHAWIVSTHPLTYKSDNIDWKRFRMAAQIKAASEQLDLSIVQFEQLAAAIEESPVPELKQRRDVVELIESLIQGKIIPREASPKDMSRFAENLLSLLRASKRKIDLQHALLKLNEGLRVFTYETFPQSASLLQVCIGTLCQSGLLSGPLQKYSCHITEQLTQLFPEAGALSPVFDYKKKSEPEQPRVV